MEIFENYQFEIFLIIAFFVVIFVAIIVFKIAAKSYLENNREALFESGMPISKKCKEYSEQVLRDIGKYYNCINRLGLHQVYNCSNAIVSNSKNNPVKYVFKYSNIENSTECLKLLDYCIEEKRKINVIYNGLKMIEDNVVSKLPLYVRIFTKKEKLPLIICDIDFSYLDIKSPVFKFMYVSPAGRSMNKNSITITLDLLKELRGMVSEKISKKGHSQTQRNIMSNDLREAVKKRDNYTCCICNNSVFDEPNLLLEVDHIIPISKGGKTEASNLQTLCWRCNRKKGSSI